MNRITRGACVAILIGAALLLPDRALAQEAWVADERADALHLLHRISFGPRPGDLDRVLGIGWEAYLAEQLQHDAVRDSSLVSLEAQFDIMGSTPQQLASLELRARRDRQRQQAAGNDAQPRDVMGSSAAQDRRRLYAQVPQLAFARAVTSERQLHEVLVDFWTNHFNVFARKGLVGAYLHDYVEEAIRPYALGRFEDLLTTTAQHPAMLLYLDNAQSVVPGATPPELARLERRTNRMRPAQVDSVRRAIARRLPTGINENYARELLELHTLGVDGGYTQGDVENVARMLTGWSVARSAQGGAFVFNAWAHDDSAKVVMGREYPAGGGLSEGLKLLTWLARHPSTQHHVSAKLCMRFVSDAAPDGCIDAAVRAWRRTDGNIAAVVSAIVHSPDFWAQQHRAAKTKTPYEFVVSAVRALDGAAGTAPESVRILRRLGQPLYSESAPTGYPETQPAWVNSGALLSRMNVALGLATGRMRGISIDLDRTVAVTRDFDRLVDVVNARLLGGSASRNTLDVLLREARAARSPADARALVMSLALGSPEFQRQ